jgi:hypothetical protein
VAIVSQTVLVACGAETPHEARANGCLLTRTAQQLLPQLLDFVEEEADGVTGMDSPKELAVMWNFVATQAGAGANASLAVTCSGQRTDGETCSLMLGVPPVLPNVDTCFRTGCEALNVAFVDVYATRPPHHLADDRVSISYATAPPYPKGTVKYDPNPLTRWRLDFTQAAVRTAVATIQQDVSIALSTGEKVDLSFTGTTSGRYVIADDTWTTSTELSIGKLSRTGAVKVTMANANDAPRSGSVTLAGHALATITQDGVLWQGACASPDVASDAGAH